MRALSTTLAILLVLATVLGAAVLLAGGKAFVYLPGAGSTRTLGRILPWCVATFIVGMGLAAVLHGVAHKRPKTYFQAMWWRDLALVVSLLAALGVVLTEMARVLTYGAL
jgi:hypothetical protein